MTRAEFVRKAVESECVSEHLDYQINHVQRLFHLDADKREELLDETRAYVLDKVARKFDPARGAVSTFCCRVIDSHIKNWMDRETRLRNELLTHAEAESKRETHRALQRPGSTAADISEEIRRLKILAVHATLVEISPEARKVAKLYMELGSAEAIRKRMKLSARGFYDKRWAPMKSEFAAAWSKIFERK